MTSPIITYGFLFSPSLVVTHGFSAGPAIEVVVALVSRIRMGLGLGL